MSFAVNLPDVERQPRVRRSSYIANQLREMIFEGTLKPGDRLPTEEKLCQHFGVSRTTLRESVQLLRVSGLLEVTPGRGSFVCLPDLGGIMQDLTLYGRYTDLDQSEIRSLRVLLELEMLKNAFKAPLEERRELSDYTISRDADTDTNEAIERQWHMKIAKVAGNKMCATLLEALLSMCKMERLKRFNDADEVMRTMSVQIRINSCLLEGDMELACRLMSTYLDAPEAKKLN